MLHADSPLCVQTPQSDKGEWLRLKLMTYFSQTLLQLIFPAAFAANEQARAHVKSVTW